MRPAVPLLHLCSLRLVVPARRRGDRLRPQGLRPRWNFAEYIALPERLLARKPASLDWNESAGLPLAGLTAYQVLNRLGLKAGETVLVHGGSGGVGSLGIQIAVARGASVIATASEKNHGFLRSLGAEPLAYGDGLAEGVRALRSDGVEVVADFVGGNLQATLAVLAEGGIAVFTIVALIWFVPDPRVEHFVARARENGADASRGSSLVQVPCKPPGARGHTG